MKILHGLSGLVLGTLSIASAMSAPDLACSGPSSEARLKLELSAAGFERQLNQTLKSQRREIEDIIKGLQFEGDQVVGADSPSCPKSSKSPKYDSKSNCLYVPDLFFTGSLDLGDIQNSALRSRASRISFRDLKFKDVQIGEIETKCHFDQVPRYCAIRAMVHRFEMSSHLDLVDANRHSQKLLSTLVPAQLLIESNPRRIPIVEMRVEFSGQGRPSDVVRIPRSSMRFLLPKESVTLSAKTTPEDLKAQLIAALDKFYPSGMSGREKLSRFDEFIEKHAHDPDVDRILRSYFLLTIGDSFLNFKDIARVYAEDLMASIQPGLSDLITSAVESSLPLDSTIHLELPMRTSQEIFDGPSVLLMLQDHITFLINETAAVKEIKTKRKLNEYVTENTKLIRRMIGRIENLRRFRVEGLHEVAGVLKLRSTQYLDALKGKPEIRLAYLDLVRRLEFVAAELFELSKREQVAATEVAGVQVTEVASSAPGALVMAVKACHVAGSKINGQYDRVDVAAAQVPQVIKDKQEFYVELPTKLINQYLVLLHSAGYFNYCEAKSGVACVADPKATIRTQYKFKQAPQIMRQKNGEYLLEAKEIERTTLSPLGRLLSRALFSETTSLKMCIRFEQNEKGDLVPADCVQLDNSLQDNLRIENALALVNVGTAIGMIGFKVFRTLGQKWVLDSMDRKDYMESTMNKYFKDESDLIIKYLRIEDGVIKVSGKFRPN